MNLLAFDTSTDAMSIAVSRRLAGDANAVGAAQVWQHSSAGGALSSASLIPAIEQLMAQAGLRFEALDAIVFGRGPGSFTGLRTACSVAQGLAFGAGVPVLPVDTLLAVAEEARFTHAPLANHLKVLAALDARMDEVYAAHYEYNSGLWLLHGACSLIKPENLGLDWDLKMVKDEGQNVKPILAGNTSAVYAHRIAHNGLTQINALPTATALLRLAPALLAAGLGVPADQALPLYIRDKVAQTTEERAADKAHQSAKATASNNA
jgi:tRNA threonylcarbamoyladenosine biosynthesis protein TsaB